ncbi:hypothetical protein BBJ28_00008067 [Nothophytophthora sp. Chile5]|nr:hypothetical protein BBJ28_00008067 [Nothophytophthora sp. Chile5]
MPRWPHQPPHASAGFDARAWCDDHICVEPDVGSRLDETALALRSARVQVLGPDACNEDKFTAWFTRGKAPGLLWDLDTATVSMPADKIAKAVDRLRAMLQSGTTTRKTLNELMGSFRHVCTCVRSASAFSQRLGELCRTAGRRGSVTTTDAARDDLRWFLAILRTARLNAIPLDRFAATQPPTWYIMMDASDRGLRALWPTRREYLQVEFND